MSLVEGGGIRDPLAALFTREGSDDEMGRADETFFHSGRRLESDACIHQGLVDATTKLTECLRKYKMSLRARGLVLPQATGVHHGKVGA